MQEKIERTINQLAHKGVIRNDFDHLSMGEIIVKLADTLDEFVRVGEEIAKDPHVDLVKSDRRVRLYNAIIKGGGNLFF